MKRGAFRKFGTLGPWVFWLLSGLLAGWLCTVFLEVTLERQNNLARLSDAAPAPVSRPQEAESADMSAFLKNNPFKVTPMQNKTAARRPLPGSVRQEAEPPPGVISRDTIILAVENPLKTEARRPLPGSVQQEAEPPPGVISRDMVIRLFVNPLEELENIRQRFSTHERGLQILWLTPRSVFWQAGVRQDDVMHSINGIKILPLDSQGIDYFGSVLESGRLDIEVTRGGARVTLKNTVQ